VETFYNEIDPFPGAWLENLAVRGLVPQGKIDTRSITEVHPADLAGYTACHFFAGIGGWPYALRLAGWNPDRPIWTGSCPCQPFSTAGAGRGTADDRHLWPAWFKLIRECRPATIFGEQVASPSGLAWLDLVSIDLEGEGYAFGAADLCAASVGAPHIRQRLYFVALAGCERREGLGLQLRAGKSRPPVSETDRSGAAGDMGNSYRAGSQGRGLSDRSGANGESPWTPSDAVWCRDGKWRPVELGAFPLAHGISTRVGRLRAYGNAIVPQVAAAFIRAACL